MGLFRRKKDREVPLAGALKTSVELNQNFPVFLSKLHEQHPPRWVSLHPDRVESVVGLESDEYMDDANNHAVWSVEHFVAEFPFVQRFLNEAQPGQTALFVDTSGDYVLD